MGKGKKSLDPVILEGMPRDNGTMAAIKVALAIMGIGIVAGATLVVGLDQIMRRIFVSESWPEKEWSNDDWAGEDLE